MDSGYGGAEQTKVETERFSSFLRESLMGSFRILGLAVGHKLGLFEHLANMEEPKSSHEIASITGLRERYVREWLGQMVGARIVSVTSDGAKYFLPKFRSDVLSGFGSSGAVLLHMANLAADITQCFKLDGPKGLEYGETQKQLMTLIHAARKRYFDTTLLEIHVRYIPTMQENLENGCHVLDVGCGIGSLVLSLAKRYPKSTFFGVDIDHDSLKAAQAKAEGFQLQNVNFLNLDVTSLPSDWTDTFDYVMVYDVLHDLPYPKTSLESIQRVLKQNGFLTVVEFNVSSNPASNPDLDSMMELFSFSLFLCMPLSLVHAGGAGLGTAVGREKTKEICEEAGFKTVYLKCFDDDRQNFQLVCKKK